jgi:predicted small integral membrane protein
MGAVTMRIGKCALVFGMGLFLCLAALNNCLTLQGTFGAVKSAVDMQGTFKVPILMWRAIESPAYIWMGVAGIVVCEAIAGLLCLWGAGRMWAARSSAAAFTAAKPTALVGLSIAAALYFIGFHAIAGEWFMLWQNRASPNLEEAFRNFASAMLMMLWVRCADE